MDTIDIMRSVKLALDPQWIMNPGKIFDFTREVQILDTSEVESARLVGAKRGDKS